MTQSSAIGSAPSAVGQSYLQYVNMPPAPGLRGLADASRDLLQRSAELPDSEQGLLGVLAEYRYAVYVLVAVADQLCR